MVMNLFFGTERRVRALLEPYVPSTAVPAWVQPDLATRSFKLSCARYSSSPLQGRVLVARLLRSYVLEGGLMASL